MWKRIYFPGDFKNRINIHLPRMASVQYCLGKERLGHSSEPNLGSSKHIQFSITCGQIKIARKYLSPVGSKALF